MLVFDVSDDSYKPDFDAVSKNLNHYFLVANAMIVVFMQCGFAFLETGSVRSKNATNILMKNLLDMFICGIAYWLVGFAFAFGIDDDPSYRSTFIGTRYFALASLPPDRYALWFAHFTFAATAATIVSGAVAERCQFKAYFVYSLFITGFVYPVVTHWAWSEPGWLARGIGTTKYQDFAGSGVVHMVGGAAAFTGAIVLGPRMGRWEKARASVFSGHSVPFAALGAFILFFGFLALNASAQGTITREGDGAAFARSVINTVISGSMSALVSTSVRRITTGKWSLLASINGSLAGMVAICASCNVVEPWAAVVIGTLAAFIFRAGSKALVRLRIDDPLESSPVHMCSGMWGVLAQPLFKHNGVLLTWSRESFKDLGMNLLGMLTILAWSLATCGACFIILRMLRILRLDEETEVAGLDMIEHGEPAYPIQSNMHILEWMREHELVIGKDASIDAAAADAINAGPTMNRRLLSVAVDSHTSFTDINNVPPPGAAVETTLTAPAAVAPSNAVVDRRPFCEHCAHINAAAMAALAFVNGGGRSPNRRAASLAVIGGVGNTEGFGGVRIVEETAEELERCSAFGVSRKQHAAAVAAAAQAASASQAAAVANAAATMMTMIEGSSPAISRGSLKYPHGATTVNSFNRRSSMRRSRRERSVGGSDMMFDGADVANALGPADLPPRKQSGASLKGLPGDGQIVFRIEDV